VLRDWQHLPCWCVLFQLILAHNCMLTDVWYGLIGLAAGGLWGFREGLRKPLLPRASIPTATTSALASAPLGSTPLASAVGSQATAFADAAKAALGGAAAAPGSDKAKVNAQAAAKVSARLRWNNVLNQVTRRGSFTGNSAGVLGTS
jgi:import inner membrane translocase subunit TIM23